MKIDVNGFGDFQQNVKSALNLPFYYRFFEFYFVAMSISEFYIVNGIDPEDPDHMDRFLGGFSSDSSEGRGCWHSTLNGMGGNAETGSPDKLDAILQRNADTHMGPFTQYHIPNEIDEVDTCTGDYTARVIQVMKLTDFFHFDSNS